MLLIVFLFIMLLLLILLFSNMYVSIQYMYEQTKQQVTISVFILRIKVYKKSHDLSNMNEESTGSSGDSITSFSGKIKSYYQKLKQGNELLDVVLRPVRLHHFSWNTAGGTGDAVTTGMLSGGLWTVKNVLSLFLIEKLQLKCEPIVHLEPNFQARFLHTNLDCMLSIRLGKAIFVFIKRKKYLQTMKEALQTE